MDVTVLQSTPNPEELVATTARGDYYEGFVGEDSFGTVMDGVSYKDRHVERANRLMDEGVSFPYTNDTVYKMYSLLDKLFTRGHFGVWEHPTITFAVEGISRVTMAQLTRHRQVSFDVQSMRYADFSSKDDPVSIPASIERDEHITRETGMVEMEGVDDDYVDDSFNELVDGCFDWYERMVEHGMPKEDARFVLPLGTKVNLSCTMNARTFMHIEDMRGKGGGDAQWEIRELTEMMRSEFEEWCPMTASIYDDRGPNALAP